MLSVPIGRVGHNEVPTNPSFDSCALSGLTAQPQTTTRSPTAIECPDGHMFDVVNPDLDGIRLKDIAKGLAFKCRYAGLYDGDHWYSIAQHCTLASIITYIRTGDAELALKVLLHDAAEAYLQDMSSPIKRVLPDYHALESSLLGAIYRSFGLEVSPEEWDEIHAIDREMYLREIVTFDIHKFLHDQCPGSLEDFVNYQGPLERLEAREDFLNWFQKLALDLMNEGECATDWMEHNAS